MQDAASPVTLVTLHGVMTSIPLASTIIAAT